MGTEVPRVEGRSRGLLTVASGRERDSYTHSDSQEEKNEWQGKSKVKRRERDYIIVRWSTGGKWCTMPVRSAIFQSEPISDLDSISTVNLILPTPPCLATLIKQRDNLQPVRRLQRQAEVATPTAVGPPMLVIGVRRGRLRRTPRKVRLAAECRPVALYLEGELEQKDFSTLLVLSLGIPRPSRLGTVK